MAVFKIVNKANYPVSIKVAEGSNPSNEKFLMAGQSGEFEITNSKLILDIKKNKNLKVTEV